LRPRHDSAQRANEACSGWAELKWSLTSVSFRSMTVPILISLSRMVWQVASGELGAGERQAPERFHQRVGQSR
jgi:hypothetical protein